MSKLKTELLRIIDHKLLTPIFQPIISLNQKKILGYEALIRGPSDSLLHSPMNLFDAAETYHQLSELEMLSHELFIQNFSAHNGLGKLFIKAHPSALLQADSKRNKIQKLAKKSGIDINSIVIELSHYHLSEDANIMLEAAEHYRALGFQLAIDHFGAKHFGLSSISSLNPEYIKIDKHYIQGLHQDDIKFNFVRSIHAMATATNTKVIAVGVETNSELDVILKIGIMHVQGFYFGHPLAVPTINLDRKLFFDSSPVIKFHAIPSSKTVEDIAKFIAPIHAHQSIDKILDLFQHHNEINVLPVIEGDNAIGLIFRDKFLSKLLSSRYGIELYGKHQIKTFITDMPISFDKNTAIQEVSKRLTTAMRSDQAFLITDNSAYFGVATILDLLEEITRQQINNAKYANPLTLLPGSVFINDCINNLLFEQIPFCVGYFDLDNFKPYNDVYGYSAGDEIIKSVADILTQHVSAESGYVGHIGGDDFIVIFICGNWLAICQKILHAFQQQVYAHYKIEHIESGGFHSEDRNGQNHFFSLVSLSVGLVDAQATSQCKSHVEISDLASEAKKQAKKIAGNSYFINRRFHI